ncbi:MAG: TonB-dependent receptor plug domain-containing protein, partial [Bacteroidales bacterium]|nr:TonB-dependent receptor plug domain-containing protein [Bacteroidales bacterium]
MKKLCVLLFLLVSYAALAQDTIVLQSVEVNADAIRQNQAEAAMERKMDTALLKRLNTITMSQLLIQHSPVFIKTYGPGGIATASFRGTTASHTLVLWNGFQLNAPTLGQVDFSTIPVFMTEQVALKWGSGTSANSGGLGGTVNIETNQHFGEGMILDLKQTYGSFNTFGSYITAGYSWASHLLRVKAYRTSSDNDFEYNNIGVIPHQVMKQKNGEYVDYGLMPEYQWRFRNSLITIVSWNQWSNRNCPQIMTNVGNADR